jgi:ATP synthase protein I
MPSTEPAGGNGEEPTPLENQAPANQWLSLLNLGWVFLATMLLCVFGGLWLDKRFDTAPLFILVGVVLGFAASGYSFYQTLRKLNGDKSGKHQE